MPSTHIQTRKSKLTGTTHCEFDVVTAWPTTQLHSDLNVVHETNMCHLLEQILACVIVYINYLLQKLQHCLNYSTQSLCD